MGEMALQQKWLNIAVSVWELHFAKLEAPLVIFSIVIYYSSDWDRAKTRQIDPQINESTLKANSASRARALRELVCRGSIAAI